MKNLKYIATFEQFVKNGSKVNESKKVFKRNRMLNEAENFDYKSKVSKIPGDIKIVAERAKEAGRREANSFFQKMSTWKEGTPMPEYKGNEAWRKLADDSAKNILDGLWPDLNGLKDMYQTTQIFSNISFALFRLARASFDNTLAELNAKKDGVKLHPDYKQDMESAESNLTGLVNSYQDEKKLLADAYSTRSKESIPSNIAAVLYGDSSSPSKANDGSDSETPADVK